MQHLDPREIVLDGRRSDRSAQKLDISAHDVYGGRQGVYIKVHTKPEVAAKLCPQIRISPSGKGMQTCGLNISHEVSKFLLPYKRKEPMMGAHVVKNYKRPEN